MSACPIACACPCASTHPGTHAGAAPYAPPLNAAAGSDSAVSPNLAAGATPPIERCPPSHCTRAWLTLLHTEHLGAAGIERLRQRFGGACAALAAPPEQLLTVIGAEPVRSLVSPNHARDDAVWRALAWGETEHQHLVTRGDPRYPESFAMLADPPPVLFVRGDPAVLAKPALAVVGSRHATRDGLASAHALGEVFGRAGLVVVSGLAAGIDSAAHQGALAADGLTAAFVGTGVDLIYPAANRRLAQAILERGALVSELALGSAPQPHHFPRRNRLIASLAAATVVVQAARQSGSLITARLAAEYGREVMAFPGPVQSILSKGCHQLIREGAALVEDSTEVAALVAAALIRQGLNPSPNLLAQAIPPPAESSRCAPPAGVSASAQSVLEVFDWSPQHPDALASSANLCSAATNAALVELELAGWVERLLDGRFQRLASAPLASTRD